MRIWSLRQSSWGPRNSTDWNQETRVLFCVISSVTSSASLFVSASTTASSESPSWHRHSPHSVRGIDIRSSCAEGDHTRVGPNPETIKLEESKGCSDWGCLRFECGETG
eukprot:841558-Rhodomonas_salina.3